MNNNIDSFIHVYAIFYWLVPTLYMMVKSIMLARTNERGSNRYMAFAYAFGIIATAVIHA